jgi:hypothetical protein
MRFIKTIGFILITSLFIVGCGRPGGDDEENAPGSYIQVTSIDADPSTTTIESSLKSDVSDIKDDTVKITAKNVFKDQDPTVTGPSPLYDVTITSYTVTYTADLTPQPFVNSTFLYLPIKGQPEKEVEIVIVPRGHKVIPPLSSYFPGQVVYATASVHLSGENAFGDRIGTTFTLPVQFYRP